jgi:hypothetical protein
MYGLLCKACADRGLVYVLYVRCVRQHLTEAKPSLLIRDKPILSLERMLHKDYGRKGSIAKKISGRDPRGA